MTFPSCRTIDFAIPYESVVFVSEWLTVTPLLLFLQQQEASFDE